MDKKRSKITPEHVSEAAALMCLWRTRGSRCTQEDFGSKYGLGSQANVGHYLNARSPLNIKAASAFAKEIGCQVSDFSPRIAAEMALIGARDIGKPLEPLGNKTLESPKVVYEVKPKTKRQRAVDALFQTVEKINDDGLERLIGFAGALSESHPALAKQTHK